MPLCERCTSAIYRNCGLKLLESFCAEKLRSCRQMWSSSYPSFSLKLFQLAGCVSDSYDGWKSKIRQCSMTGSQAHWVWHTRRIPEALLTSRNWSCHSLSSLCPMAVSITKLCLMPKSISVSHKNILGLWQPAQSSMKPLALTSISSKIGSSNAQETTRNVGVSPSHGIRLDCSI